jgi:SAM-dependent methyltransferase
MSTATFGGEMGRIQRALAACHDAQARRLAVVRALGLRTGERVLEIGCGGGSYLREAAAFVGAKGSAAGIDISDDQIAAARETCADMPWVECRVGDAATLPYKVGQFDGVFCVQVLEYMQAMDGAITEIARVLRTGGRLVVLATNWDSLVWHSAYPERMARVLAVWGEHALSQNLPAELPARLRKVGLTVLGQQPVPIINGSFHENSFSYWLAPMVAQFCTGRAGMSAAEVQAWLGEFEELEQVGAYHFSSLPILTLATKTG